MPVVLHAYFTVPLIASHHVQVKLTFDQTVYHQTVAVYDVGLTVFVLVILLITSGILNKTINNTVSVPLQRIFGMIMHAMPGSVSKQCSRCLSALEKKRRTKRYMIGVFCNLLLFDHRRFEDMLDLNSIEMLETVVGKMTKVRQPCPSRECLEREQHTTQSEFCMTKRMLNGR